MAHERNELMQQQISAMQLCLQRELAEQHSLEAERAVLCQNIALQVCAALHSRLRASCGPATAPMPDVTAH